MVTFRDADSTVSGDIDTLVVPTNAAVVQGSTGTILTLPTTGPGYSNKTLGALKLLFMTTMNQEAEPIVDRIKGITLRAAGGTPLYEQTGHFTGGSSVKLGRDYGLLTARMSPFLGLQAQTSAVTLAFWAKLESADAAETGDIVTFYKDVNNRFFMFNDTTEIQIGDVSGGTSLIANVTYADLAALDNPIDLFDGAFHLFVVTIANITSGRQLQFFIDGQLLVANNDINKIATYGNSSTLFNIGGENLSSASSAVFDCDEMFIAEGAMVGSQVQELYNGGPGVSLTTAANTAYGYEGDAGQHNSRIIHAWTCNESGGKTVGDYRGFAPLQADGVGATLGATGRWPGTKALAFTGASGNRASRIASFDGPNAGEPWAVSLDAMVDNIATSASGDNSYIFEIGDGSNTSAPYANMGIQPNGTHFFLSLDPGGVVYLDYGGTILGDGLWHTITFGVRRVGNVKQSFLAIDGNVSTLDGISWPDLSADTLDVIFGQTLKFTSYGHRSIVGKIQNVTMWKNANFDNEMIQALVDAQLKQLTLS